jgi:uncharacterized protein
MPELLADRAPWYVAGILMGLVVVGLLAAINGRLGVLGAYSEVVERVSGRRATFGWKAWFLVGIVAGSTLYALATGGFHVTEGYGWLSRELDGRAELAVGPILVGSGALIGYGAKTARGCTSGNGLCGTSLASAASLVATMTFMATGIVVSLATRWLVG